MIFFVNNSNIMTNRHKVSFKADLEISENAKKFFSSDLNDFYESNNVRLKNEISSEKFRLEKFLENLKSKFKQVTEGIPGVVAIEYSSILNDFPQLRYYPNGKKTGGDYYDASALINKSDASDMSDILLADFITPLAIEKGDLENNPSLDSLLHKCAVTTCDCVGGSFTDKNPFAKLSFDISAKKAKQRGDEDALKLDQKFKNRFGHPKD